MVNLPASAIALNKTRKPFETWLVGRGSEILAPTNSWEVLRFTGPLNTCIIYRDAKDRLKWINGADEAYLAYLNQKPWRAVEATQRDRKTIATIRALAARDGWGCMYCSSLLTINDATIEHVVSVASGGTNHLANKTLACEACNQKAGHMSVREKIEMVVRMRCQ